MAITPYGYDGKRIAEQPSDSRQEALLEALAALDRSKILEIDARVQAELYVEQSLYQVYQQRQQEASTQRVEVLNQLISNASPEEILKLVQTLRSE